jgi:hypothetical protein
MKPQFTRRNIDEVRRVGDDQVPLLGCLNAIEIIGLVDRNPLTQSVLRYRAPACFDRFRIDIGETQCVAKPVAQ